MSFLYILLYIEIPCTILILQKRYAHDTFAAGRAYMPTQEKKKSSIQTKKVLKDNLTKILTKV